MLTDSPTKVLSIAEIRGAIAILSIEIILYSFVALIIIFMVYKLLIRHRYFKELHMVLFYIFAMGIVIMRIAYFSLWLKVADYLLQTYSRPVILPYYLWSNVFNDTATWFKFLLGLT